MKRRLVGHKIPNIIPVDEIDTIHYFELDKNFQSRGETHDCWEFVYVDKGVLVAEADGVRHILNQGDAIFHKPDEYHTHSSNKKIAPNIFIITFVCKSASMEFFQGRIFHIPEKIRHLIASILNESNNTFEMPFNQVYLRKMKFKSDGVLGGLQMIRTYLEQFLILLLRSESSAGSNVFRISDSEGGHIAAQMAKTIDKSVYGPKTSVEEICNLYGYSRAYLSRVFRETYGCTMTEYMSRVKIDAAKRLMREQNLNFTQISDTLLFSNPLYFSRVFKRVTGMSPTEYCRSIKMD